MLIKSRRLEATFSSFLGLDRPLDGGRIMGGDGSKAATASGSIDKLYSFGVKTEIGSGAFAQVYVGVHTESGARRAIKRVCKECPDHADVVSQEALILKQLDHHNIVQLYEVFEDTDCVHLVTELGEGGELFTLLRSRGRLPEAEAAAAMRDLLSAVAHMHSRDVVHRDLKPENLVLLHEDSLRNNVLKVIDFGVARHCRSGQLMHSLVGTSYYTAPEVLLRRYYRLCDIWSAGVILFTMLSGSPPFTGKTDAEVMRKVRHGSWDFERVAWATTSQEAKDSVKALMKVVARARPSAARALRSRWLTKAAAKEASVGLPRQSCGFARLVGG